MCGKCSVVLVLLLVVSVVPVSAAESGSFGSLGGAMQSGVVQEGNVSVGLNETGDGGVVLNDSVPVVQSSSSLNSALETHKLASAVVLLESYGFTVNGQDVYKDGILVGRLYSVSPVDLNKSYVGDIVILKEPLQGGTGSQVRAAEIWDITLYNSIKLRYRDGSFKNVTWDTFKTQYQDVLIVPADNKDETKNLIMSMFDSDGVVPTPQDDDDVWYKSPPAVLGAIGSVCTIGKFFYDVLVKKDFPDVFRLSRTPGQVASDQRARSLADEADVFVSRQLPGRYGSIGRTGSYGTFDPWGRSRSQSPVRPVRVRV